MSREEVIRQIVARESRQCGLLEATVCEEDAELYNAACEQFGTWETALEYAGVDVQRLVRNRKASPRTIRSGIRRLAGGPHRLTAVVVSRRHWRLYHAALRQFGSWRLALEAAGVNPKNIHAYSRQERPSRQQIIDILVKRSEQGLSLRWIDVCCENRALAVPYSTSFANRFEQKPCAAVPGCASPHDQLARTALSG